MENNKDYNKFIDGFLNVQNELKAPKNQYNSFGKYNYRSCEDIVEAAKPLCVKNNLVLTLSDEIVETGGRIYVKATAKVTDGINSICSYGFAREAAEKKGMDDSQVTGSTSSYARKYALNGLFCIDDTKDADTDSYAQQTSKQAKPKETKRTAPKQEAKQTAPAVETMIQWQNRKCEICGNVVEPKIAEATMRGYKHIFCSGFCKEKAIQMNLIQGV